MKNIEIRVPDIGDINNVEVIEILVAVGDSVAEEDGLISIETDKATMEIPSPAAGIITELTISVGDRVSEGTLIATLETISSNMSEATPTAKPEPATPPGSTTQQSDEADLNCDLVVVGGGPGGYSAAFRAADLGLDVVLVERYPTLGGVCLNVGCIPSKALLHVASVMEEVKHFKDLGVDFSDPDIDLAKLRSHKEGVIGKLTGGLAAMAKMRKVKVVEGSGQFVSNALLTVDANDERQIIGFKRAIIAAGSESVQLPFLPEDERIVDSTGALKLKSIPERMLIIGGGIIGLEMGSVYAALGSKIDVVEMLDDIFAGADKDLIKVWKAMNKHRFNRIMTRTKTVSASATDDGIAVCFDGGSAPQSETYDLVLQAVGRRPNGHKVGAEAAGIQVDERGFITVDKQQRTNIAGIFAIGDIVGQPMLAHKAVHEGHVAAEVIAGEIKGDKKLQTTSFDAHVIPSVAYTDPEIAWVGLTENQANEQGIKVRKGVFPWSASGRAIANGCEQGFSKLLFDIDTGRILGGAIVGPSAGDMIGEVALAIEMGADDVDIGKTIHPHPTLGESIGLAAEAAHGSCTDLPPVK
ncbi:dihydrolipoyl dehydrogenase [Aestuariicella hydrocarbonica]|uniref:Dihydrolipoyl dehydrogenase n=1 Tax=Pseudomaricurvus hydrocarbonicus TaxID=1470433 RepID=A0A9E5JUQ7_9GAMM|nr:dihydrolipoyl dehydrogenase [Aestuariicella hydrocarbonica]